MSRHDDRFNLAASLLVGTSLAPAQAAIPRRSLLTWCHAIFVSLSILAAFDRAQSPLARTRLARVCVATSPFQALNQELRQYLVLRDCARLRAWIHGVSQGRACYAESLALCAGLRVLGWKTEVVIAFACIDLLGAAPMHAWIEYEGEPISDPMETPLGYVEIERILPRKSH